MLWCSLSLLKYGLRLQRKSLSLLCGTRHSGNEPPWPQGIHNSWLDDQHRLLIVDHQYLLIVDQLCFQRKIKIKAGEPWETDMTGAILKKQSQSGHCRKTALPAFVRTGPKPLARAKQQVFYEIVWDVRGRTDLVITRLMVMDIQQIESEPRVV